VHNEIITGLSGALGIITSKDDTRVLSPRAHCARVQSKTVVVF
jgi:hypothetical protein